MAPGENEFDTPDVEGGEFRMRRLAGLQAVEKKQFQRKEKIQ